MPKPCEECHHMPSGRFNGDGLQCHCQCHDLADTAPELLALIITIRRIYADAISRVAEKMDDAYSIIYKTKGD